MGQKLKHIWVGNEYQGICLSVSFFIPSLIFHFHCQFAVSLSFFPLGHNVFVYDWLREFSINILNKQQKRGTQGFSK
ncbi:MAG: hypothetical protein COZ76_07390 [Flavobacteriales bacterium CG_4_8_14_3_um_filter_35_10]|nr:MAG: hypothetical protein AUJ53_10750 [Flavobacteriaceae bacterium CG1_02_35_72]PIX06694.1 MAG: hypothetical protein COZ76_07390 [Flavobacteriales bacterium CG_4_8_14_3_um_filter_35_10]PJA05646.1 MAG: hypothetical protein COX71_05695 [Flavobacteriales bacterium CG_4_10_14_0_2_um_filter_35_18]